MSPNVLIRYANSESISTFDCYNGLEVDEKKRSVCLRLAYEVPCACIAAWFIAITNGQAFVGRLPSVSYSDTDVMTYALGAAILASFALFFISRPKKRNVKFFLLFYPLLLLVCYVLVTPVYSQMKFAV